MGWTGQMLENGYILFTRGGLNGVYIGHENNKDINIEIPEEKLIALAADHVRSAKISQLEDAGDLELLGIEDK